MSRTRFLPFYEPSITSTEITKVTSTLSQGWLANGPVVEEFEKSLGKFVNSEHVVAVSSGTAALHLAVLLSDIEPGDEVITTPLTFASTVSVIMHAGATPVLVDVEARTGCIDAEQVKRAINSKTKAILAVDYAGHPANLWDLRNISRDYGLSLIEDAAHALSATYDGQPIGSYPHLTAFSFYASKTMTTAEGGVLICPDESLEQRARQLSLHGMSRQGASRYTREGTWYYDILENGYKYNMSAVHAAIGIAQLSRIQEMQRRRYEIATKYQGKFKSMKSVQIPYVEPHVSTSWHLYPLRISDSSSVLRDDVIKELKHLNIGTSVHFIPIHYHTAFRRLGYSRGDLPIAEDFFSREISLPLYPGMTDSDVIDVVDAVRMVTEERG